MISVELMNKEEGIYDSVLLRLLMPPFPMPTSSEEEDRVKGGIEGQEREFIIR